MASSSSPSASTGEHRHLHHSQHDHAHAGGGIIPGPPPPTPSNPNHSLTHVAAADGAISRALRQLAPPALSLPPRPSRLSAAGPSQLQHTPTPPVISLAQPQEALLRSAASELGFFHLTDHGVPSHLPVAAQIECQPLFQTHQPDLSLLGFDGDDSGEDNPSFLVFDVAGDAEQGLPPAALEYARRLEKVGMEVVEMLARAGGFRNPLLRAKTSAAAPRSLVWITSTANGGEVHADRGEGAGDSDGVGDDGAAPPPYARCYPYAVCLQYQMRSWGRCLLLGDDSSWTTLEPHADSILVAVGDIAQVWSDGGFKKVRGVPAPAGEGGCGATISVLVTLSTDSVVSPVPPAWEGGASEEEEGRRAKFSAFAFEEYAWRRFHEQFPSADPLRRYRRL